MNLGIMCGSYESASITTRLNNSKVASLVASKDYTIVMSARESGSMRDIKEIIRENGNSLIAVGKESELDRVDTDIKIQVSSPFERLEALYENSDIILFLTGGLGTLAELYAFYSRKIEEQDNKPLIIYNEDHSFDLLLKDLNKRNALGLIDQNYNLHLDVANNEEELVKVLEHYEKIKEKGKCR